MKIILSLALSFLFFSCNEEFNPLGEYQEKYVLTCILRSDTSYQTAYLSKNNTATSNGNFSSVSNADVRVWYNDSVYVLNDTTSAESGLEYYYTKRFKVAENRPIEVEVQLPDGRRLRSQSTTPGELSFLESEVIVPPSSRDYLLISWDNLAVGTFYSYRLLFNYTKNSNGIIEHLTKEIPLRYSNDGNALRPVFPSPSNKTSAMFQLSAVTEALRSISENDPDKSSYSIHEYLTFELFGYDEDLSRYISSTSGSFDNLTIRLNELDFTNISGGLGIFGSFSNKDYELLRFQFDYINSFGYKFIPDPD